MIHFEIDQADLDYVNRKLTEAKVKVPQAIRNVLNRIAREARKKMVMRARAVYAYKPGFKIGDVELRLATITRLEATIRRQGPPRTLQQWKYSVGPQGVSGSVLKSGAMKLLGFPGQRAFIGPGGKIGGLIAHRKGPESLPVRVPHGPSIPKMLEMVYTGKHGGGSMEPEIQRRLHEELRAEVAKHL